MKYLFVAALAALAACTPAPATEQAAADGAASPEGAVVAEASASTTPEAPAGEAFDPGDDAVQCLTFIRLETDALSRATPPGDTAALDHAFAAWRTRAETHLSPDELAQFFASNVAVMDDTPPAEIKAKADACVARIPAPTSTP